VTHGYNVNHHLVIKHLVDHAIIPSTNAPEVLKASQPAAAEGTRVLSQSLYPGKYPADNISAEAFQFLSG